MKNVWLVMISVCLCIGFNISTTQAQNNNEIGTPRQEQPDREDEEQTSCYRVWWKIFNKRGAEEVADGEYTDLVVSFRRGKHGLCYVGTAVVKKGFIKEIKVKMVDGTFETVQFDPKEDFGIKNGISDPIVAYMKGERQVLNVIFTASLRSKGPAYQQAPTPNPEDYD